METCCRAIETRYGDLLFRSRMEARWAIFMDAMNVRFIYEPEAYSLGDLNYLPDFFIPRLGCFIEIKPTTLTRDESEKAHRLCEYTKKDVFVFFGNPNSENPCYSDEGIENIAIRYYDAHCAEDYCYAWCECRKCGYVGIEFNGRCGRLGCDCEKESDRDINTDSPRLLKAYSLAVSHRFYNPIGGAA